MQILIAEDSSALRQRLRKMLSDIAEVDSIVECATGVRAIELTAQLSPDIIILDVRMPQGNGLHVLQTVKKFTTPPIAIVITAYNYPQYRERSLKYGAEYFVNKSDGLDRIAEIVNFLAHTLQGRKLDTRTVGA